MKTIFIKWLYKKMENFHISFIMNPQLYVFGSLHIFFNDGMIFKGVNTSFIYKLTN